MKIVVPGGSGQLGAVLARALRPAGHEVIVIARNGGGPGVVAWDGKTLGHWAAAIDGADAVLNLAGRSVNCRYTASNMAEMMASRVDSTRILGQAIAQAARPPRVWLQMSTATIYAHRFDAANDEISGVIGGSESDAPAYWKFSIDIAQAWEKEQADAHTPRTRKVALRTAMVMSPDPGGVLDVLLRLVRFGLGGPIAGGQQYISWIHETDFVRAVEFLIQRDALEGPVNVTSPGPVTQREFMRVLREVKGRSIGLPATGWMVKAGAFALGTDAELVLKSRRVVPKRLLDAGFRFEFPDWTTAARDLVARRTS